MRSGSRIVCVEVEIAVQQDDLAAVVGIVVGNAEEHVTDVVRAPRHLLIDALVLKSCSSLDEAFCPVAEGTQFQLPGGL